MSASWKYVIGYLLVIQLGLGLVVPQRWLYDHRVPYEVFKEDPRIIDLVLDHIDRQIKRERLTNYVIMLGDSVGYSGPGGPKQSIGYYMEELSREQGKPLKVFNLALPAMQTGDIYVVLLKLRQRGIATDRVIINLLYGGFVARNPDPPIAFWLADDLAKLDLAAWKRFREHLARNGRTPDDRSPSALFDRHFAPKISLLAYRPVLKGQIMKRLKPGAKEVYDTRPWTEKPELPRILAGYEYQNAFNPAPFVMTEQNPQIYFLQKIIAHTGASRPLIYLTPTNQELMKANVSQKGYQENLGRIDAWFQGKPVTYLNWERSLEDRLFSDHVHLTPEGYRILAEMLLAQLNKRG
ncbi:MAG: hypothetical protein ACOY94_20870 [Bacillota bacterium]